MAVQLATAIYLKINGQVADDVVMGNLLQLIVDQHCLLPDMFQIRLTDPGFYYIDSGLFDLGTEVEIGSFSSEAAPIPLISGEITALEPEFTAGRIAYLLVRGYDCSHRLYRQPKSRAFINVKDSDLAQQIANEAGLYTKIASTQIVYEHILQHNQSDLDLLHRRAARLGYACYVSGQTLHFHPPDWDQEQPINLVWGDNNLAIRPHLTVSEQVDEVIVRGWDPEMQQAVVGHSTDNQLLPEAAAAHETHPAQWLFGHSRSVIVDEPVSSQNEADIIARAMMAAHAGSYLELTGSVFRRPDVQAGRRINLEGIGQRFSGSYLLTQATHCYDGASGLVTEFAVRGLRRALLSDELAHQESGKHAGVMIAIVTNNNDPLGCGRVKLKYPWLTDEAESFWARVLAPGDAALTPAVGEEVLVSFEAGDMNRPVVLGKLPKLAPANHYVQPFNPTNPADTRTISSRAGHAITLGDGPEARLSVESSGGHRVELNDQASTITIASRSGLVFTLDDNRREISVSGGGAIKINAGSSLELAAGGNVTVRAGGQLNLKGALVNIN